MKHVFAMRPVAAAAVVALLLAFAAPAMAAPATGFNLDLSWSWSSASVFQWVQSVWTGWFGTGDEVEQGSGVRNVYGAQTVNNEPDGVFAAAPALFADGSTSSLDGRF